MKEKEISQTHQETFQQSSLHAGSLGPPLSFSNSLPQHNRYCSRQARQNVPVVLQEKMWHCPSTAVPFWV